MSERTWAGPITPDDMVDGPSDHRRFAIIWDDHCLIALSKGFDGWYPATWIPPYVAEAMGREAVKGETS